MLERFRNSWVRARRIQFVIFVVRKKKFQRALAFVLGGAAAQSAANKLQRDVADVAGEGVFVEFFAAHFAQRGADGADQIAARIDYADIRIDNQRTTRRTIRDIHEL